MSIDQLSGAAAFQKAFRGDIITPSSASYEDARKVWNGDIDRRPLAVVRPTNDQDVSAALQFAQEAGVPLAIKGAGHSYAGHSMVEKGITIDMWNFQQAEADLANHRVKAGGGARLGAVDNALVPHGQVMPAGVVSHTGMPGLALGGGVGYNSRSFGLTCDQFIRLKVVLLTGEVVHASETENPDLFWALRGGGGNFGVVTEFECRTHDLGPYTWGFLAYPSSQSVEISEAVIELARTAPRAFGVSISYGIPAQKFGLSVPESRDTLVTVMVYHRGTPEDDIIKKVKAIGKPLLDTVEINDFLTLQTMSDEKAKAGIGWYMKSGYTKEVKRDLLEWMSEASVDYTLNVSSPHVERDIYTLQLLGGAIQDTPEEATAYTGREAQWHSAVECGFTTPAERERIVSWIQESWKTNSSYFDMDASYVNLNTDDGDEPVKKIFGAKYARLQEIKSTYDPNNVLALNWNIKPLA
ncbi:FAD-binding protein [Nocardioides sp. zg-579]|uniref:FAD-binding protein n=1 Tax=Nocardioides marmotae TaxID=2663857 RepID=A0A6I3J0L6_9ACTN|nr:FAD-binding oxidoreductase [Nocardioides marmotae]MCR6030115.1 FAD-binding protein [Gordonia jinghuaiqii]MTB93746.1 FAD-binding protein [Nocardioides marmotae]QKE00085.1 FAD-binding oxidoreductase [Nocardioides marmotae]